MEHIGTKLVNAKPMTRGEFSDKHNKPASLDKGGLLQDAGYEVEYKDGYCAWSPKSAFDAAYKPITNMDFGAALVMLKDGEKVARAGWNGKGMYITMKPGYPDGISCNEATAKAHGIEVGTTITYCPYLEMKTADNKLVPWLASQTDILAEDWTFVQ